ncbi:MAG: helix-hairpin-helix domain-containing protein [Planctomycetota bacterium]|nr:helix-hairpin-helix domain-containing protein [Planctomycetota bacterium]
MRTQGTSSTVVSRQPGSAAKMAAVFVLGAAASAGYFAFSTRAGPATVQATPPPTIPPIIVQLVQPPAAGAPATGAPATGGGVAGAIVTPTPGPDAGSHVLGVGSAGSATPDAWVLVGPPEPVAAALLRQVEVPAAPQALTQTPQVVPPTGAKPTKGEARPTKSQSPPALSGVKIDLNTATQAQLESLPLVGPSMAKRIIEYRAANGPYMG